MQRAVNIIKKDIEKRPATSKAGGAAAIGSVKSSITTEHAGFA